MPPWGPLKGHPRCSLSTQGEMGGSLPRTHSYQHPPDVHGRDKWLGEKGRKDGGTQSSPCGAGPLLQNEQLTVPQASASQRMEWEACSLRPRGPGLGSGQRI